MSDPNQFGGMHPALIALSLPVQAALLLVCRHVLRGHGKQGQSQNQLTRETPGYYRGFFFRMEDDGEVELWAETREAQVVWRSVDSNAELWKDSSYIFCGHWRPPSEEAFRAAIDELWERHAPTQD